jgi:hypothetical protein
MKGTAYNDADSLRKARSLIDKAEAPFEMANLRPVSTGLPMTIWVSERGRARHGPRVKVSLKHGPKIDIENSVSATIEDEPRVIGGKLGKSDYEAVQEYIRINREALLSFWHGEIDTAELIRKLKRMDLEQDDFRLNRKGIPKISQR